MSLLRKVKHALRTAHLGDVTTWYPERVKRLQKRRLQELVHFAVQKSSFFRAKYAGLDLENLELSQIPPLTKDELMDNFDAAVTDPKVRREDVERFMEEPSNLGQWFRDHYAVSHTSGSQGRPLLIVQDRRCLEINFAILSARSNVSGRPGILEGLRRLRSPSRVAVIAQKRGFYPSGASFEFMQELAAPFVRVEWFSVSEPDLFERLNEFQPNVVVGYASVLEALAIRKSELQLRVLKQIANSSEQLTSRARERIRDAFNVPIFDHYGLGECLLLSEGCPSDGGAHVNADWAILEVVDENNLPVYAGEVGAKVFVTNLANRIQPFIRYEVHDRVAMANVPCRCGSRLPRIDRIEGRAAELFWVHDGKRERMLSGALFHSAADSLCVVREWQAVQLETNLIEFRIELLPNARLGNEDICRKLVRRLVDFGLPTEVAVHVRIVPELAPNSTTGKFQRMIRMASSPLEVNAT